MRRAVGGLVALGLLLAGSAAHARPALEVRIHRGVAGVVAAGGIDVVELEVASAADVALRVEVAVDGRGRALDLAARGTARVTLARRVPPGAAALPPTPVTVRAGRGAPLVAEIPGAPVVHRPVLVVTDDAAALVPRVDAWRRGLDLGPPLAVAPDGVPAAWPALVGVGAVVLDRPAAALDAATARRLARFAATGGLVCVLAAGDAAAPRCVRAAPLAVPRTRQLATIGPVVGALAALAVVLTVGLGLALALRRARGRAAAVVVLLVGVGAAPFVRSPDDLLQVRGVRAAAGGGEDWIAAEVGAAALGGLAALGGELWLEPSAPLAPGAIAPLDDVGLRGQVPAAGSWRVRGFVAATAAGWAARLTRVARPVPELP